MYAKRHQLTIKGFYQYSCIKAIPHTDFIILLQLIQTHEILATYVWCEYLDPSRISVATTLVLETEHHSFLIYLPLLDM